MKIGIHQTKGSFSERWIAYCEAKQIAWRPVDCYRSDIIQQLADCDALMWHFQNVSPKDFLFAKQLLFSLQASGKIVFPDFNTSWHFDDKVGQKYLLESISAPLAPSYVFYSKKDALVWANQTTFPKVFKLRTGGGSANVKLVKDRYSAVKLINKAFSCGFGQYDSIGNLKERIRKYRLGKESLMGVMKGFVRLLIPTEFSLIKGREKGYVYFQEFIPGNDSDIRVVVIGDRAFAIKRLIRKNDFRASGSGDILYNKTEINENCVRVAFETTKKLDVQCMAYDFVYYKGKPLITEISYGFIREVYDPCPGYWSRDLTWHEGKFNPQGWMVDLVVKSIGPGK